MSDTARTTHSTSPREKENIHPIEEREGKKRVKLKAPNPMRGIDTQTDFNFERDRQEYK